VPEITYNVLIGGVKP